MNFSLYNIISNPVLDLHNWTGPGIKGGDPGLELIVSGGDPSNGYVQTSEVDSSRVDLLYGSYRAMIKVPATAGTCSSVYWVSRASVLPLLIVS
jgi:hypothetical protein